MDHRSSTTRQDGTRVYSVTVALIDDGDHDGLLVLASVLHRRGVRVAEAKLTRAAHGRQVFDASFSTTPRMAASVLATLQNQVKVLDAVLFEVLDMRSAPDAAVTTVH
jgi:hypothetical protein